MLAQGRSACNQREGAGCGRYEGSQTVRGTAGGDQECLELAAVAHVHSEDRQYVVSRPYKPARHITCRPGITGVNSANVLLEKLVERRECGFSFSSTTHRHGKSRSLLVRGSIVVSLSDLLSYSNGFVSAAGTLLEPLSSAVSEAFGKLTNLDFKAGPVCCSRSRLSFRSARMASPARRSPQACSFARTKCLFFQCLLQQLGDNNQKLNYF